MKVTINGEAKSFQSFNDFIASTTRKERNALIGSSLTYKEGWDINDISEKIDKLIEQHSSELSLLQQIKVLVDKELAEQNRKEIVIDKLRNLSLDKLELLASM